MLHMFDHMYPPNWRFLFFIGISTMFHSSNHGSSTRLEVIYFFGFSRSVKLFGCHNPIKIIKSEMLNLWMICSWNPTNMVEIFWVEPESKYSFLIAVLVKYEVDAVDVNSILVPKHSLFLPLNIFTVCPNKSSILIF